MLDNFALIIFVFERFVNDHSQMVGNTQLFDWHPWRGSTLGDPVGLPRIVVFTGTLGSDVSVWKISVFSWIILLVASPLRNGDRSCGSFTAEEISSNAAMILFSEDVFGMLYLIGRN